MQKEQHFFMPIESKIVQKEIRILNESKAVQEFDPSKMWFFFSIHNQNKMKLK